VISMLSFVCSVGNVPLAAVLWNGGISFGGVISLHLCRPDHPADPEHLSEVLRGRTSLYLLGVSYAAMALAGFLVGGAFSFWDWLRPITTSPFRNPAGLELHDRPGHRISGPDGCVGVAVSQPPAASRCCGLTRAGLHRRNCNTRRKKWTTRIGDRPRLRNERRPQRAEISIVSERRDLYFCVAGCKQASTLIPQTGSVAIRLVHFSSGVAVTTGEGRRA